MRVANEHRKLPSDERLNQLIHSPDWLTSARLTSQCESPELSAVKMICVPEHNCQTTPSAQSRLESVILQTFSHSHNFISRTRLSCSRSLYLWRYLRSQMSWPDKADKLNSSGQCYCLSSPHPHPPPPSLSYSIFIYVSCSFYFSSVYPGMFSCILSGFLYYLLLECLSWNISIWVSYSSYFSSVYPGIFPFEFLVVPTWVFILLILEYLQLCFL